jgi:hypothetical protein
VSKNGFPDREEGGYTVRTASRRRRRLHGFEKKKKKGLDGEN